MRYKDFLAILAECLLLILAVMNLARAIGAIYK